MAALPIIAALLTQLIRLGAIGAEEVDAMADQLDREGEAEASLFVRGTFCETAAADMRLPPKLRLIRPDGGNDAV